MPRLRKKFDPERSPVVYSEKVLKVWKGVAGTAVGAEKLSEIHADRLLIGSLPWHKARVKAMSVLAENNVERIKYGSYLAAMQFYIKNIVDRNLSADNAMEMVRIIFPNIDENIFSQIIAKVSGISEFGAIVPVPKPKAGVAVEGKPTEVKL